MYVFSVKLLRHVERSQFEGVLKELHEAAVGAAEKTLADYYGLPYLIRFFCYFGHLLSDFELGDRSTHLVLKNLTDFMVRHIHVITSSEIRGKELHEVFQSRRGL